MGCLCPKNANSKNPNLNDKLNEEPEPTDQEDLEANHITIGLSKYQDIDQKRKFVVFLLNSDLNVFKKHLEEVRQLSDNEFNELFEGNTDFNFSVNNIKQFRQLVQKFEDNKELLEQFYNKEEYYGYVLQIWKKNILQKLKEANDNKEKDQILIDNKIDTSKWDDEFKNDFQSIINTKPIKELAERMKNYIEADYGNFDELIKNVNKCKNRVKKTEKNHCNLIFGANLNTSMNRILKEFVPKFLKNITNEIENIPFLFKKKEKEKAIDEVKSKMLSSTEEKELIDEIKKIYEKSETEKNDLGFFDVNKEFEQLNNLSHKFNEEHPDDEFDELFDLGNESTENNGLKFEGLKFEEKANAVFSNKMIKHAILGISLANSTYSVLHCANTLMNYKLFSQEFRERLDSIKNNFEKHQSNVKLIPDDIDEAIQQVIKCGQDFNQDLEDIEELINDINNAINGVKTERNSSILNLIGSSGGLIIGIFGLAVTKGDDRVEYATASLADVLAIVANSTDIVFQSKLLKEYAEFLNEAKKTKEKIIEEIDKLRKKFKELKVKHFS
jgi:hypothetical protein